MYAQGRDVSPQSAYTDIYLAQQALRSCLENALLSPEYVLNNTTQRIV